MKTTDKNLTVNQILSLTSMVVSIIEADSVDAALKMVLDRGYSRQSAARVIDMAPVIDGWFMGDDK